MAYIPRIVDQELSDMLGSIGAVVLEGPRATGKTQTARHHARSEVLLDVDERARTALSVDPGLTLEGETPRLIDEWQTEPSIWNHIRRAVDDRGIPGQFILTGSAVPADDVTRHTGAGRIMRLRMRPMTLLETGHSTGGVSFKALMDGESIRSTEPGLTVPDLATRISVGGWPRLLSLETKAALAVVRGYVSEIRRFDVQRVAGSDRDPARVAGLIRSLARNTATPASIATLAADTGGADGPITGDSVRAYLGALDRLMITDDLPPWAPHLRSKARVRAASKRHLVDPSIAVAALRASPERLLADLNYMGLLFESMVVRDLRVYGQTLGAEFYHYRDSNDLEVDVVVELPDGRWAGIEVKLGHRAVEEAVESLKRFAAQVSTKPVALIVVDGFGYGYTRPDGVSIVPVGALGP